MPFFIPAMAIGAGSALFVWGVRKIFTNDDSADERAAEIMKEIPKHVFEHIEKAEVKDGKLYFELKSTAPNGLAEELKNNIKLEEEEIVRTA